MAFEQVAIAVQDEPKFAQLHALIDAAFDAAAWDASGLLNLLSRSRPRIRDYETILSRGWLGKDAIELDQALPVSDQALTRERYLRLVEAVPSELRQRYFKAYAYY